MNKRRKKKEGIHNSSFILDLGNRQVNNRYFLELCLKKEFMLRSKDIIVLERIHKRAYLSTHLTFDLRMNYGKRRIDNINQSDIPECVNSDDYF